MHELIPKHPTNYGKINISIRLRSKQRKKDDNLFGEIFQSV